MLEVDDEGGRVFLRVLIHLTMHDYAPLVSGALQLLFKHFSQRQEAMHTFEQVLAPLPERPALGEREEGPRGLLGSQQAPSRWAADWTLGGDARTEQLTAPGQLEMPPWGVWPCRAP